MDPTLCSVCTVYSILYGPYCMQRLYCLQPTVCSASTVNGPYCMQCLYCMDPTVCSVCTVWSLLYAASILYGPYCMQCLHLMWRPRSLLRSLSLDLDLDWSLSRDLERPLSWDREWPLSWDRERLPGRKVLCSALWKNKCTVVSLEETLKGCRLAIITL